MTEYLKRKPADMSGGQRQRVALGRAIVRDAPIFLMDEPLSNLDAKLRVSMRAEIAKIHHQLKTTTIYVTHDQVEAMTLADRIVIMKDGKIQQVGTPQEVYRHPVNVFVGSFIGSPAMNFCRVHLNGDHVVSEDGSMNFLLPEGRLKKLLQAGLSKARNWLWGSDQKTFTQSRCSWKPSQKILPLLKLRFLSSLGQRPNYTQTLAIMK